MTTQSIKRDAHQARMTNPAVILPQAYKGIGNLLAASASTGIASATLELIGLRVSQLNGCATCLEAHVQSGTKAGLTASQMVGVAAYRESPFFTDAEKIALELADALTKLADAQDSVSEELWSRVTQHYNQRQCAALVVAVATHNLFNRINIAAHEDVVAPFWMR